MYVFFSLKWIWYWNQKSHHYFIIWCPLTTGIMIPQCYNSYWQHHIKSFTKLFDYPCKSLWLYLPLTCTYQWLSARLRPPPPWHQMVQTCWCTQVPGHIAGLVQDCSNSSANALELLQSFTKPAICPVASFTKAVNRRLAKCPLENFLSERGHR